MVLQSLRPGQWLCRSGLQGRAQTGSQRLHINLNHYLICSKTVGLKFCELFKTWRWGWSIVLECYKMVTCGNTLQYFKMELVAMSSMYKNDRFVVLPCNVSRSSWSFTHVVLKRLYSSITTIPYGLWDVPMRQSGTTLWKCMINPQSLEMQGVT